MYSSTENLLSTTSVNSASSIDRIADFSTFFISGINESNGIVEYSISSFAGAQDITVQIVGDKLKIEEGASSRSSVFNKIKKTIIYYEGLVSVDIINKYIDDLLYIYYQYIKEGNNNENSINYIASANDDKVIHTAMSIRWRKSLAVEGCQRLIDGYLKDHPECSQL